VRAASIRMNLQDPLAREGAELLALKTAAQREPEALEDEERREMAVGNWLARSR
jgi:hypothetical protein